MQNIDRSILLKKLRRKCEKLAERGYKKILITNNIQNVADIDRRNEIRESDTK